MSLSAQGSLTGLLQYGFIGYLGKSLIRTKYEIGDLHGICCMSHRILRDFAEFGGTIQTCPTYSNVSTVLVRAVTANDSL